MAPKISPPPAATSDHHQSDSDDHRSPTTTTTTTTSSSSEPHQSPQSKHQHPPNQPHLSDSDSDADSDSDSDADSDSDSDSGDPISTTVANKRKNVDFSDKGPMKKKPHVSISGSELKPHFKTIITALPAITKKGKNTREKVEKDKDGASSSMGRPMFQRIWSEHDEIVILKGLVEFRDKYGKDPMCDVDMFLDFVKGSLHVVDVKREQIVRKIRRLKTRFQNGKKRSSTNAHEVNVFNLSKIVWGGGSSNGMSLKGCDSKSNKNKSKSKSKASVSVDNGGRDENVNVGKVGNVNKNNGIRVEDMIKVGDVNGKFMEEGLKLIGEDERAELEEEWRNLNVARMEGLVKRLELYRKTAKSLLNVVKSSSSKG